MFAITMIFGDLSKDFKTVLNSQCELLEITFNHLPRKPQKKTEKKTSENRSTDF